MKADVVVGLRIQHERLHEMFIPSLGEYYEIYGITKEKIMTYTDDNSIFLHPGPIHRGVEVQPDVPDIPKSKVQEQVKAGIALRMALLELLCNKHS